jgi:glycosyltransferase involved in cell wall biosynthesis
MPEIEAAAATIDLTIFVACYNEEANIIPTLDAIQAAMADSAWRWEAIVIDDASEDRSVALVEDYMRAHPAAPIRLAVNESNRGLAQNYIEGAFLGRGAYYRLVCGDNAEDVDMLRQVFAHVGAADLVLFYHVHNERRWLRRIVSRAFTMLVNALSGYRLRYYNGCAIMRRADVMRWHTNYHGFGFQADMTCRLLDEGRSYCEVPVRALERQRGHSKAFTIKNLLSVAHTLVDLFIRRTARLLFRRSERGTRCIERFVVTEAPAGNGTTAARLPAGRPQ